MTWEGHIHCEVDAEFVQRLAAANGLWLTTERAADLVPAVQILLNADAQLARLNLDSLPTVGMPWESQRAG